MSDVDLVEAIRVLRDEVLDTVEHGDRDPPGAEVFDAIVSALADRRRIDPGPRSRRCTTRSRAGSRGATARRSCSRMPRCVFDRLMIAVDRALRDPPDRMVVIEAATQVAVTVARVVSLAAVARAARDRAARLREEMAQKQLEVVLEKQRASIVRMELDAEAITER